MEQTDFSRPRTARQYLRLYLTGFAMGAADIVPGVSGGTMAFILGIYETLIEAIKSFNLTALRLALGIKIRALLEHIPFGFLIALGLGILSAILALSNLLGNALETHAEFVFAFFGGLVLASIISIGAKIRWNAVNLVTVVVFAVAAFVLVGLNPMQNADHSPLVLFFSGMIAIVAMILPGISGSFILLLLGQYKFVLDAVRGLDIVSIAAVGVGCVVGIVGFSRILSWLLKNYEQVTIAALVGFMIGSLRKIWEGTPEGETPINGMSVVFQHSTGEIAFALALFVFGFVLVSLLDHLQSGSNPLIGIFWRRPRPAV
jgi:putative membrane protein